MGIAKASASVALLALGACQGSVQAEAETSASVETPDVGGNEDDFDQPLTHPAPSDDFNDPPGEPALLGARHDVELAADHREARCRCLAVSVGPPGDAAFDWQARPPSIDRRSQSILALSSEDQTCPGEPDDSQGASYWGYRRSGDDVIVVVEMARFGRPLTEGAVIPKPTGNGQVYIEPKNKRVPYGRPLDRDDGLCAVGSPGAKRALRRAPSTGPATDESKQPRESLEGPIDPPERPGEPPETLDDVD